jgi:hypothetical protein
MPKIPDSTALGQAGSLRSGRAVVTARDVDMSAKWRGLQQLGAGVASLGDAFDKQNDQNNALDLMRAEAAFKQQSSYIDRDLDSNPNYDQHDSIYTQRQGEAADQAAGLIQDPKAREKWRLKADIETEQGRDRVLRRADIGNRQLKQGDLEGILTGYQNSYAAPESTQAQRDDALRNIDNSITLAERSGIVNPAQARKLREQYQRGAVISDIERRTIEDPEGLLRDLERGRSESGPAAQKPQGMQLPGNIDLRKRSEFRANDGSISPMNTMVANVDDNYVLIPTVKPDGTALSSADAIERYKQTGERFGVFDTQDNAQLYQKSIIQQGTQQAASRTAIAAAISTKLETGKVDPLKGLANISKDSNGSKSYGNFGLNSQGSMQQFLDEYGDTLGALSGTPGTKEFDRSWKAMATGDPETLHAAEMQWYSDHVGNQVGDRLKGIGLPDNLADDPRVQAYFADRSIQQGEGSIGGRKHADRINEAAAKANGDPVRFLRSMTELDREALYEDFPSALKTGIYSPRGHDNRLDQRLNMSLNLGGRDSYSVLSPLERATYEQKARTAVRSAAESSRNQYKQMLEDDVASVRKTGNGVDNFDLEGAKAVLDKSQISKWDVERAEAQMEYDGLHDLNTLSNDGLSERLRSLEPASGQPGFGLMDKVYKKAAREVDQIRKQRLTDPATSVEHFPEVRDALGKLSQNPNDPASIQDVIRARIDAQNRIGIPAGAQSPIPLNEARQYAAQVKGLQGKALYDAITPMQQQLTQTYGPYARAVSDAVVDTIVRDKELAKTLSRQMDRTFRGLPPTASQVRETEIFNEGRMATQAFQGENLGSPFSQFSLSGPRTKPGYTGDNLDRAPFTVGPMGNYTGDPSQMGVPGVPQRAIDMLKANPALAPTFDAKYGKGSAATILSIQGLK